jgi:hypothetical protein
MYEVSVEAQRCQEINRFTAKDSFVFKRKELPVRIYITDKPERVYNVEEKGRSESKAQGQKSSLCCPRAWRKTFQQSHMEMQ